MGLSIEDYRSGRRGLFIYWDETKKTPQNPQSRPIAPRLIKSYHHTADMMSANIDKVHEYNGIIGQNSQKSTVMFATYSVFML